MAERLRIFCGWIFSREASIWVSLPFLALILAVFLWGIYGSVRLYYTGECEVWTIKAKDEKVNRGGYLQFYLSFEGESRVIEISEEEFDALEVGEQVDVFASNAVQEAMLTELDHPSLAMTIAGNLGLTRLFGTLLFVLLLLRFPLYSGWKLAGQTLKGEFVKEMEKRSSIEHSLLRSLVSVSKFIPHLIIISLLYALLYLLYEAALSIESSNQIGVGLILLLGIFALAYLPFVVVKVRIFLMESKVVKVLVSILKITIGFWTLTRTVMFIQGTDLRQYDNLADVFTDLLKFFVDF